MHNLKQILTLLTGGLLALNTCAADAPDRSLHVLYLGPASVGGGARGGGFGGSRTNYVYLPGQTLAPEAIYFDHLSDFTHLTDKYLSHFDVGQDRWEEINVLVNGGNYGWRLREGFDGFDPKNPRTAPTNAVTVGADGKPFVDPVFTYKTLRGRGTDPEAHGVTITGGYVYRGKAFPALVGKYIFADWSRSMAIPDGTLLVATIPPEGSGNARWTVQPLALKEYPSGRIKSFIWTLGEDSEGELYVLANGINSAFGTRGKVLKLVPQ